MSDLASAGVTQVIEVADHAIDAAIEALEGTARIALAAGHAVINVGDKTLDTVLDELRTLKDTINTQLSDTADAVSAAIPGPV